MSKVIAQCLRTLDVITVSSAFSAAPNTNAAWMWEVTSTDTELFRVIAIGEDEGTNYNFSCLKHDPSKYAAIEAKPLGM